MKEHRQDLCPDCGHDHSKGTLQKPGMSKIEHRDKIAELCEELYQVGILHKEKNNVEISEYDGKAEPGFTINQKFLDNLHEHYKIQEQIEYMDKLRGIESKKDYGGLDRDTYLMGIAINDFLKVKSSGECKTCQDIVFKKRGDEDVQEVWSAHMKKDHPDVQKKYDKISGHIREWIILIRDFIEINNRHHKEWRSN